MNNNIIYLFLYDNNDKNTVSFYNKLVDSKLHNYINKIPVNSNIRKYLNFNSTNITINKYPCVLEFNKKENSHKIYNINEIDKLFKTINNYTKI